MINSGQAADIALAAVSLAVFLLYHVWLFCLPALHPKGQIKVGRARFFNAQDVSKLAMDAWVHCSAQQGENRVGVCETLRNSIWICTLFATAVAYIGARGLTEAFLYSKEAPNIFRLDRLNVFNQAPIVPPMIKAGVATCLVIVSFLAFALATRNYVWVGFMMTVMNAKYTVPGWHIEGEIIATLRQAELHFSIGTRSIVAFACALAWLPGSIALFVVTLLLTGALIVSDHQLIKPVDDLNAEISKLMAEEKHDSERQDVEAHHLQVYGFSITPSRLGHG